MRTYFSDRQHPVIEVDRMDPRFVSQIKKNFHILLSIIFILSISLDNFRAPYSVKAKNPQVSTATYTVTEPYPDEARSNITRQDEGQTRHFQVLRVVQSGQELGLMAIDLDHNQRRVDDFELEQSLIFEAETLRKWYLDPGSGLRM
jgi:hypothetical protein